MQSVATGHRKQFQYLQIVIYLCLIIFGTPEFYAFIVEADTLTSKSISVNEFYNVPLAFAVKQ